MKKIFLLFLIPIVVGVALSVGADVTVGPGSGRSSNATSIHGRTISGVAPTNGQVLAWTAATNSWGPVADGSGLATPVAIAEGGTAKALTLSAGGIPWVDADSFEILVAGTSGKVLTSGGAAAPTWEPPGNNPTMSVRVHGDMMVSGVLPLSASVGGDATAALDGNTFGKDHPGVATMQTGTGATNYATLSTVIHEVGGSSTYFANLRINTLSTIGEEYSLWVGWGNTLNGAVFSDGYYFKYDRLTSTNWLRTTAADTSETATSTGVAVAAGAFVSLKIVVNAARTSATYYIDGVDVGTNSANIPPAADFLYGIAKIVKSAGTTNRTVNLDVVDLNLVVSR